MLVKRCSSGRKEGENAREDPHRGTGRKKEVAVLRFGLCPGRRQVK